MPTFILKKYNQEENKPIENTPGENTPEGTVSAGEKEEQLSISVTGSISQIVATALHKVLDNKASIEEVPDQTSETPVKAISTEDINNTPLDTFNSINKDDTVFIHNTGFKTVAEEWLLTNISNKTTNVFYTIESFIAFVKTKLKIE